MRKKWLVLIVALVAAFSLAACSGEEAKPQPLTAPQNVTVSGDTLSWDAVNGAESYIVSVNAGSITAKDTSLPLTGADVAAALVDGDNTLKVRAVRGEEQGPYSAAVTYAYTAPKTQLAAPVIVFDAAEPSVVTWSAIANATGYKIHLDGAELPGKVTTCTYTFAPNVASATIKVKAIGGGNYTDSEYSNELSYVNETPVTDKLAAPVLKVSGKTVTWEDVPYAQSYTVSVNGGAAAATQSPFTLSAAEAGDYVVTIVAVGDGDRYEDSAPAVVTITLEKLAAPALSVSGRTVTWTADGKAAKYQARINDGAYADAASPFTLDASVTAGDYVVKVRAIGDGITVFDSEEATADTITIVQLAAPTGLVYTGNTLSWTGTADKYEVKVVKDNGTPETFETAAASKEFNYTEAGTYVFTVRAIGDGILTLDSEESQPLDKTIAAKVKLGTPAPTFSEATKTLSWAGVRNADGYEIEIRKDGSVLRTEKTADVSYTFTETEVGVYTFRVKATTTNLDAYVNGEFSAAVSYTVAGQLAAPSIAVDDTVLNKIVWEAVPHADKYEIYVNSNPAIVTTDTFYAVPAVTGGTFTVKVKAVSNGAVYAKSEYSGTVTVTIAQLSLSVTVTGRTIAWTLPAGAVKVQYKINDGEFTDAADASISVDAVAGSYTVILKAVGDGMIYLDSEEISKTIVVEKLAAPVLTVDPANGLKVTWGAIANAKFQISTDNKTWADADALSYTVTAAGAGSYTVYVKAIGLADNYLDSDPASKTIEVVKLAAPENVAYAEATGTLTWDAVANARGYEITYTVSGGNSVTVSASGNSYALGLSAAGTYSITVTATGDEKTVLSSDASTAIEVTVTAVKTKLTTPEVTLTEGVLNWNKVENAVTYAIELSGADTKSFTVAGSAEAAYTFDLTAQTLTAGKYAVKVRALPADGDESYAASDYWTGSYTKTVRLGATTITVAGQTVNWTAVPNAVSYTLYKEAAGSGGSTEKTVVQAGLTDPTYTFEGLTAPFIGKLYVEAVGDGEIYLNSESVLEDAVISVTLSRPTVTRDDVNRKFTVEKITGVQDIKYTYIADGGTGAAITYADGIPYGKAGTYKLTVYYTGTAGYNQSPSYTATYTVLGTPENIVITKDKITFDAIAGVESYKMVNNGGDYIDFAIGESLPAGMNRFYIYAAAPSNDKVLPSEGRYYTTLIIDSVETFNLIVKKYEKDANGKGADNMWGVSSLVADIPDPTGIKAVVRAADSTDYNGTFLGNGFTIGSAAKPLTGLDGLFGHNYGVIENLTLYVSASGTDYVGGLAKDNLFKVQSDKIVKGVIRNVTVYGMVRGTSTVGGIVGANCADIFDSVNRATVTGTTEFVGGIAGNNKSLTTGTFTNSGYMNRVANYGAITGGSNVGGIVGKLANNAVDGALNTGTVLTTTNGWGIGGIAGITLKDTKIFDCLNTGVVGGSGKTQYNLGGIVGKHGKDTEGDWENSLILNCVNTGVVYADSNSPASSGLLAGQNFTWLANPAAPASKWEMVGGLVNCASLTGNGGITAVIGDDRQALSTAGSNSGLQTMAASLTQAAAQTLADAMNEKDLSAEDVFTVVPRSGSSYIVVPAWCAALI